MPGEALRCFRLPWFDYLSPHRIAGRIEAIGVPAQTLFFARAPRMKTLTRRSFIAAAAALGAGLAFSGLARASRTSWTERRDLYPDGVASGDPEPDSVILWTRRPFESGDSHQLSVEVAL